eukprot:TRINITY_DN1410_c0_g1_i3.p2 TRINITY_DN1410_c0_g1~~TRINITY_DN1410_c0_g1_i3.p2  ORF type:complete len:448 (+),score=165.22 TRINITY_DN1410_c0_g1_i3:110-1453(+)
MTGQKYTWQEVAKHNSAESAWIYIENKVYDITKWLDEHPGGKDVLLLVAGRDCTNLFESYHPFSSKPHAVLKTYYIGDLEGDPEYMQYKTDSGFYRDLRREVGEYFKQTGKDPKDPMPGLLRLVFILTVAGLTFGIAYNQAIRWPIRLMAAAIFGVFQALPLLHCMHDASHTAIGKEPWMWKVIGLLTMDWFAGASINSWHHQHIIGHHAYTNVLGADPDLPVDYSGDVRRVMSKQRWQFLYRLQPLYLPILYGVLAIKFRVQDVMEMVVRRKNGPIRVNPMSGFWREAFWQLWIKSLFLAWRFYFPLYVLNLPASQFWALFFVSEFATGYWLTFNFQVSHVSPLAVFTDLKEEDSSEWAVSQVQTTVDYAHGRWLPTFLCGALNYQTVHHLFPSISQYHYPAIAPIIQKVCKQHKIRYNVIDGGFLHAFYYHIKHLVHMSFPNVVS